MAHELDFLIHQEKAKQMLVIWESLGVIEESKEVDEESTASFQQNFQFGQVRKTSMAQDKRKKLNRFQT